MLSIEKDGKDMVKIVDKISNYIWDKKKGKVKK